MDNGLLKELGKVQVERNSLLRQVKQHEADDEWRAAGGVVNRSGQTADSTAAEDAHADRIIASLAMPTRSY